MPTLGSNNPFPSILIDESSAAPSTPSAGFDRLYVSSSDAALRKIDSGGNITRYASQSAIVTFAMGGNVTGILGVDPADATTYNFGDRPTFNATTGTETLRVTMPKAGTAMVCYGTMVTLGTLGTTGHSTFTLHNRTAVTSATISSTVSSTASSSKFNSTGLALAFSAGDELDMSWLTPTWGTNPTDVIVRADLYVEFNGA